MKVTDCDVASRWKDNVHRLVLRVVVVMMMMRSLRCLGEIEVDSRSIFWSKTHGRSPADRSLFLDSVDALVP